MAALQFRKDPHYETADMDSARATSSNEDEKRVGHGMAPIETLQTTYDQAITGELYRNGQLVRIPAPSRDPRDPMNLSLWRKVIGLGCLSFFGALIASAELILGACLPVFAFEYSPPFKATDVVTVAGLLPAGSNGLEALQTSIEAVRGPPIFHIYLLATVPVLVIGVANLALVPLAISIGRRPVIILTGLLAIAGAAWAGESQSLYSHVGARVLQAVGAGSVESLIPFIIQDITYVHERNTWISAAFACQGVIIIAIGFSTPYMIVNLSWRWVYHVTAICAAAFLVGVIFLLPETRWNRTRAEMNGIPRDDKDVAYRKRSYIHDLGIYSGFEWKKGFMAFIDTMRTFFYPSMFFVTLLNGSVIASAFAAGFTAAPVLLIKPWDWPFHNLGLCLVPVLIGAILVGIVTGSIADYFANFAAKRRGQRIPENQLINLALPWACSLVGSLLFGITGGDTQHYHWAIFLLALGLMAFGFLGTSTITTVYVLESYPNMAGSALVNVASFRWIMAFLLTLYASDWIVYLGYKDTFLIYTGLIAFFGLCIPVAYYFGPAWRRMFPGKQQ